MRGWAHFDTVGASVLAAVTSRPAGKLNPVAPTLNVARLSITWTLDSARCVWMPTPCSRASRTQPSRNSHERA